MAVANKICGRDQFAILSAREESGRCQTQLPARPQILRFAQYGDV